MEIFVVEILTFFRVQNSQETRSYLLFASRNCLSKLDHTRYNLWQNLKIFKTMKQYKAIQ